MDNSSSDPFLSHACDQQAEIDAARLEILSLNHLMSRTRRDLLHARAQVACLVALLAAALLGWWLH